MPITDFPSKYQILVFLIPLLFLYELFQKTRLLLLLSGFSVSQVSDTLEVFGWDLTDAINKKDKTNALIILESLVRQQIDPNIIMAILTSNLKQLTQVHLLQKTGAPSNEMAKALGSMP